MTTRVQEAAEELRGSCKSLEDVLTETERDDLDFLHALDEIVMECQGCNWWCETDELDEDQMCGDCQ